MAASRTQYSTFCSADSTTLTDLSSSPASDKDSTRVMADYAFFRSTTGHLIPTNLGQPAVATAATWNTMWFDPTIPPTMTRTGMRYGLLEDSDDDEDNDNPGPDPFLLPLMLAEPGPLRKNQVQEIIVEDVLLPNTVLQRRFQSATSKDCG